MGAQAVRAATVILVGLLAASAGAPALAADPAAGKAIFASQCAMCHSIESGRNSLGPSLFGIVGRKTGSVPGFHYSTANKNADMVWDEATLDKYLQAPMAVIKGTTMTYGGVKDDGQRANLVAYLSTIK